MKKGLYITFEGLECCGKTTQLHLLSQYLVQHDIPFCATREPGSLSSQVCLNIRKVLFESQEEVTPLADMFLFQADRAQHIAAVVKPALEQGKIVLSDRGADSTIAYQGYGKLLSLDMLVYLNTISLQGLVPDLTFILDISVKTCLERLQKRGKLNKFDDKHEHFYARCAQYYTSLINSCHVHIHGEQSCDEVFHAILNVLLHHIE